jgi:hypothetical protein
MRNKNFKRGIISIEGGGNEREREREREREKTDARLIWEKK